MEKKHGIEKISHSKLGHELELFTNFEEAPGMPFFLPNGLILRNELEQLWRSLHKKANYQEIKTPIMMKQDLWEKSGHWEHYHKNMYFSEVDNNTYAIKPMNCPGAVLIYNNKRRSYRELPVRYSELGLVHRQELSGSLNGLLRVRAFTQDDAHIFVSENQIKEEIYNVLTLIHEIYSVFGFSYRVELSTRPENYMGDIEVWDGAEKALERVLIEKEINYTINPGDGAFYGPKIDFHIYDSLGRSWQCGTVQLDFQLPTKFNCSYVGEDNKNHTPILIHRAIYGSIERFMAILIEHYEGRFPLWLSPVQVVIIPINDSHLEYAYKLQKKLEEIGLRIDVDSRNEKVGLKIRENELKKIPYMLVIGDDEILSDSISVRKHKEGNTGKMNIENLITILVNELNELK